MNAVSTFAVIANDTHQVLLSRRADDGEWELPGGRTDKGESPWVALSRELHEEVAVDVAVGPLAGMYFVAGEDTLVLVFRCSIASGQPQATAEVVETGWFDAASLPTGMRLHHGQWLEDALRAPTVVLEEY